MTTQTPIEMAREVAANTYGYDSYERAVEAAELMHARLTSEHQAAVAELVEGLEDVARSTIIIDGLVRTIGGISPELDTLIAKHRAPDAFDTRAEGLIDE